MEDRLLQLFPDQVVQLKEYSSFINQPERIQITSQEDMTDYDPTTLTTYYNFRVRLPRPALNVKTLQLARCSLPMATPSIQDTELVFWYYALPTVSAGTSFATATGQIRDYATGDAEFVFDAFGVLYTPAGLKVREARIFLNQGDINPTYVTDSAGVVYTSPGLVVVPGASINYSTGTFVLSGVSYTYNIINAEKTPFQEPVTPVPLIGGTSTLYITFAANNVFYDSGTVSVDGVNYTYDKDAASPGNVWVNVLNAGVPEYQINYITPERAPLQSNFLRYTRLVPSNAQPELLDNFLGGFNRTFQDYDDLVTELYNTTVDDLLNGEPSNEIAGIFKFTPNLIAFSYNPRFNKFVFTGLNDFFSYCPASSDDPNVAEAAAELQQRDIANTRFAFSGAIKPIQPYQPYRNLNLRLGFTYATYPPGDNFFNMLRPVPTYITGTPNLGDFTKYDHVAPGYGDLVYSACCHLYTDITGGSTVDSLLNKSLLGSIPMNTPNLGIGFHSLPLNNPLTKIATQLNEIYIEMRTDTGAPFYIGNNGIVSLEFILTY